MEHTQLITLHSWWHAPNSGLVGLLAHFVLLIFSAHISSLFPSPLSHTPNLMCLICKPVCACVCVFLGAHPQGRDFLPVAICISDVRDSLPDGASGWLSWFSRARTLSDFDYSEKCELVSSFNLPFFFCLLGKRNILRTCQSTEVKAYQLSGVNSILTVSSCIWRRCSFQGPYLKVSWLLWEYLLNHGPGKCLLDLHSPQVQGQFSSFTNYFLR